MLMASLLSPKAISIHALREEGDPAGCREPARRAISIHALREEGDLVTLMVLSTGFYFYPRPPRGGRPPLVSAMAASRMISIHALREEGDPKYLATKSFLLNFYPRPPRGGRLSLPSLRS